MYEWVKAFHIISIVAWMAGLFYLPRLMLYHSNVDIGSEQSETFKVMERRLLKVIMMPAMIASWSFGLWLVHLAGVSGGYWFVIKFCAVLAMTAFHVMCGRWVRNFSDNANQHTSSFFRIVNEIPTFLLCVIVIMVVVKPF